MRKHLLIAGPIAFLTFRLLLTIQPAYGADQNSAPAPKETNNKLKLTPMNFRILPEPTGSDGSPIIVGSGSFHIRQYDYAILPIDPQHFHINLYQHEARSASFGYCKSMTATKNGSCTWALTTAINVNLPWVLQLLDTSGSPAGQLAVDYGSFPQFVLVSSNNVLTPEADNGGDGEGYMTSGITLGSAQLTQNGSTLASYTCAAPSGNSCTIRILYCKHGASCS